MAFIVRASWPISSSVRGSGTRWSRVIEVMACARDVIADTGRRARPVIIQARIAIRSHERRHREEQRPLHPVDGALDRLERAGDAQHHVALLGRHLHLADDVVLVIDP